MLVVAGKFDPDKTLRLDQRHLRRNSQAHPQAHPTYTEEPTQDGEREVVLRRAGDEQMVMMAYHIPAGSHPDAAALEVLAGIMGEHLRPPVQGPGRDQESRSPPAPSKSMLHDPGLHASSTRERARTAILDDAEKTMLSVIDGVVKEPPSKDEVDRARTRLLKDIELSLNNSPGIGLESQRMGLHGRLAFAVPQFRDRIEKVTPEDVARVAKLYLKASNRTTGTVHSRSRAGASRNPRHPGCARRR